MLRKKSLSQLSQTQSLHVKLGRLSAKIFKSSLAYQIAHMPCPLVIVFTPLKVTQHSPLLFHFSTSTQYSQGKQSPAATH